MAADPTVTEEGEEAYDGTSASGEIRCGRIKGADGRLTRHHMEVRRLLLDPLVRFRGRFGT